jgi:hypothetical protein
VSSYNKVSMLLFLGDDRLEFVTLNFRLSYVNNVKAKPELSGLDDDKLYPMKVVEVVKEI